MTPEAEQFAKEGRLWLRGALLAPEVDRLAGLSALDAKPGARHGRSSALFRAVEGCSLPGLLQRHWPGVRMTRLVAFNKSAQANWRLPWHQDRVVAVDRRTEALGYGRWSRKSGIWHCEPPLEVLQSMLFVRVHLDDAEAENGAMEIAVGSHREGKVAKAEAAEVAAKYPVEVTRAKAGDVLVLAMLTLHRSANSEQAADRRVLRADFSLD